MPLKQEKTYTLPLMPWRGSLLTAGSQSSMPENMLWEAENVSVRLDGTLTKRPGVRQWGQTIAQPDVNATDATVQAFVPFVDTSAPLVLTDTSAGLITTTVVTGEFRTAVPAGVAASTVSLIASHPGTLPAGSEWSLRFMFRGINLQAYVPAATEANTFAFRGQAVAGSGKEFAVWAGGIYYKRASDNTYVLIDGTSNVGEGVWSMIEVRVDDGVGGTTQVYVDDELVATVLSSLLADVSPNGFFEFEWQVVGTGVANTQYNTYVITPMYNDSTADPFLGQEIVAGSYFPYQTSSGARVRSLVVAAGDYIYHDNGQVGVWRPLLTKSNPNVFFNTYNGTLTWCDFSSGGASSVWQWTGGTPPILLDDAPPIKFTSEHKTRLFGAGDPDFPLRLYYTGSRQANLWFTPTEDNAETETDAVLEAGYIPIPSGGRGDAITAIWGEFYGLLIVATRTNVFQLNGSGPGSFSLDSVSQSHGIEAPLFVTQVGNDLWYGSRFGIHSILTTDKYGQLTNDKPSTAIGNLWSQQTSGGRKIAKTFLASSKIVYSPQQQLILAAVPLSGSQHSDHIYAYSQVTEGWYGPWDIESRAMFVAEIVSPLFEVVMHGSSDGKVGYTYEWLKADYETGVVDMRIATAALSGRTVDPSLHGQTKTWKTLNLYIQPRGDWDFSISWFGDNELVSDPRIQSQRTKTEPIYVLSDDFRLDVSPDGVLRSDEDIRLIRIPLDERSIYLYLFIEESAAGEDLIIQGAEIEFTVSQHEGT